MNAHASRAAWRQPLVWLVFALPAMSVVAGLALLWFAEGPIDAVADPVRRTAQVQDADLAPDLEAVRLALTARVRREGNVVEVLPIAGAFDRAASLDLMLRHPVLASEDRRVSLVPSARGWRATMVGVDDAHDWLLELAPADRRWRLRGRWQAHADHADVAPALGTRQ
jgi:hypothetical protein